MTMTVPAQGNDQVTRAALGLFSANGYERTTLQMIASAAGLSGRAVTGLFRTKDALLDAALAPALADLERLSAENGSGCARPPLDGFIGFLVEHRIVIALLERDPEIRTRPAIRERMDRYRDQVRGLCNDGRTEAWERVYLTAALAGLMSAVASFPELSDEELHRSLRLTGIRLLGRGRRTPRPAPAPGPRHRSELTDAGITPA
ncbi:helix-turn-helix domain-containing protein [Streptosporangium longisporum]|uniref:HTH tetR-type domain-containing protein n=1 Tax=Streptosporangium longisporum TaxID=46187 RepID=A0ABP6KKY5_9ACTN